MVVSSFSDVNRRGQTGKKLFERHIEMVRGAEAGAGVREVAV